MDAILYWNRVALDANQTDFSGEEPEQGGPTLSSRAMAMVHLAMYDAFVGADKANGGGSGLDHYLPTLPTPDAGTSADAAIAAAAHATLSELYPSQASFFDQRMGEASLSGPGTGDGYAFGQLVAQRIQNQRRFDPGVGGAGYPILDGPGCHRPDPDNPKQGIHAPYYGANSRCFAARTRHSLDSPFGIGTPEYLAALQQVRAKGIAPELQGTVGPGTGRTAEETLIGIYWAYDGARGLGTPPRLYNQIIREVAEKVPNPRFGGQLNTLARNAELFALVNAALGDAGILAWERKFDYKFWRPVLGIREHDPSLGPQGMPGNNVSVDADPLWLPLGAPSTNAQTQTKPETGYPSGHAAHVMVKNFTPNFPAYPSGHATFGAAALHMTRLFYGRPVGDRQADALFAGLSFVSEELNGVNMDNRGTIRPHHNRSFPDGLWQMIVENGFSRIFLGVHWSFDAFALDTNGDPDLSQNVGGVPLGLNIAEDIFTHKLKASQAADPE